MRHFLRDNGKKIMAVVSAVLMITFFLPTLRGTGSNGNDRGSEQVASIFNGQVVTAYQEAVAKKEWDLLSHHIEYADRAGDQPTGYLGGVVGPYAKAVIDTNPLSFLILVDEAKNLGIRVNNDELQDVIQSHVVNLPDESDPDGDVARQAVYDVLLVHNLLDRVGDSIKVSQPAQARLLALTEQDVSLSMAELSAKRYLPDATQPTTQQVQAQFDKYRTLLPDKITDDNPLGFGYSLPDRVKLQFIGFKNADLLDHVKASHTLLEWQTLARRLYRTHTSDFPIPTTGPTTQTLILGAPDWEKLPPEVAERVFNQVYDSAAADLRKKISEWLTDQLASDYAGYHDALSKKQPPPATINGGAFDSDEYLRHLAAAARDQFGVPPVLGFINNGWKSADDLALVDNIGPAQTAKGQPFGQYAATAGAKLTAAASLDPSDQLALWQPSQPVYVGGDTDPKEFYIFRLTDMDPSHPQTLDEARDSVISDLRIEQAWKATLAEADALAVKARQTGVAAVAAGLSPAPAVINVGKFRIQQALGTGQIPGLTMPVDKIRELALGAKELLTQQGDGKKAVTVVKFPSDRTVALVELTSLQANWPDIGERLHLQSEVANYYAQQDSQQAMASWCVFDEAAKRTQFKVIKPE